MSRIWIAAALAAVAAGPAVADDPAPKKGSYVVLVGVGEFADKTIAPRPTAEADARAMYDLFNDPQYSDAAGRVALLTATPDDKRKAEKATRDNVVKAIHKAVAETGKDDTVIIGLFGRVTSAADKTCLIAADTTYADRAKTGVLGSELEADLKALKDRKLALILDLDPKGFTPAGNEPVTEPKMDDILNPAVGLELKGEQPMQPDKLIVFANDLAHTPLVKGQNGLFTAVAIDALKGAADVEGYAPDGLVTVDEFAKYMEREAANAARAVGTSNKEKETLPLFINEETSHFPLAKNPKVTPTVTARLAALAKLEAAGAVSKDVAAEGKALLSRMPKLKSVQGLRKQYEGLADGTLTAEKFAEARQAIKDATKLPAAAAAEFAKKVEAAVSMAKDEHIKKPNPGDLTAAAIKGLYRRLEEPLPADIKEAIADAKDWAPSKQLQQLRDARTQLGQREDLADGKDADIAVLAAFQSIGDPHTTYFDKALLEKTASQFKGEFRGIGAQIMRDAVRDGIMISTPIKGSPAYRAGVKAGDLIREIKRETDPQGKPLASEADKVVSTKGMKVEEAVDLLLGKPGVPVTLVLEREGEPKPVEITISRGPVSVETVLGVKRDDKDDWGYFLDPETKIAYVHLTQFAPTTIRDLSAALAKMQRAGMKGLVLDLRFNPGGMLVSAAQVCNLFIDEGRVVSVRGNSAGEEEQWLARGEMVLAVRPGIGADRFPGRSGKPLTGFPMVVMVNEYSASAAEIVSACLQDYGRAVVVGERSYGKGSVQQLKPFPLTDGQVKITTARYFPPLDRNIDRLSTPGKDEDEWGVKPDKGYDVKLSREEKADLAKAFRDREIIPNRSAPAKDKEKKEFVDKQLNKALEYLNGQLKTAAATATKKDG